VNYNGRKYPTRMRCCRAKTPALYETRVIQPVRRTTLVPGHNIKAGYGHYVYCDSNAVMT